MAEFRLNIRPGETEPVEVLTGTAGETLYSNEICYLATDGKWYKTNASNVGKCSGEIRFVVQPAVTDAEIKFIKYGVVDIGGSMSAGTKYYLSTSPGAISTTQPTGLDYVRYVGSALSANFFIFNPDKTYIRGDGLSVNEVVIQGDKNYIHDQITPSSSWSVTHNLGKKPSVTVIDTGNNEVEGEVVYIDDNSLTINFNSSFAGIATLN